MKVPDLKDALAALGEDTSGKQVELVARLEAASASPEASKEQSEALKDVYYDTTDWIKVGLVIIAGLYIGSQPSVSPPPS